MSKKLVMGVRSLLRPSRAALGLPGSPPMLAERGSRRSTARTSPARNRGSERDKKEGIVLAGERDGRPSGRGEKRGQGGLCALALY